ncbi:unnamed protein product [Chondrus crispus]|uniref:Uncharacterized protein n=1 Tax=Chondrus crispus TaxID=2769 RepID=R7QN16_CHOCR|nr:unnamed protein product [Chondrus crispus]CDF39168.1 unnamed protein product [Chondrus crispus]|eukprot:XP_005719079.1 unnamed protein product [Chondrus crispus]
MKHRYEAICSSCLKFSHLAPRSQSLSRQPYLSSSCALHIILVRACNPSGGGGGSAGHY